MRNQTLDRSLRLLRLLQRGRCSMAFLAGELACHQRTIRRHLEVLSVTGFPVQRIRDDGAICWYLDPAGGCPCCARL